MIITANSIKHPTWPTFWPRGLVILNHEVWHKSLVTTNKILKFANNLLWREKKARVLNQSRFWQEKIMHSNWYFKKCWIKRLFTKVRAGLQKQWCHTLGLVTLGNYYPVGITRQLAEREKLWLSPEKQPLSAMPWRRSEGDKYSTSLSSLLSSCWYYTFHWPYQPKAKGKERLSLQFWGITE